MMVIYNPENKLFWCNKQGWVGFESCQRFTNEECRRVNRPMGGIWYAEEDGKLLSIRNKEV